MPVRDFCRPNESNNNEQARLPLHRKADPTGGGRAADHRARPVQRRLPARRADLCGDRALALSACAHPRHRFIARAQDEGRARRVHRRRLSRRQARTDPARSAAEDPRRHEAARAGRRARSSSARTCCCRPTRRAMSARRWRWWSPKPRTRRSTPPRRSRSTTKSCPSSSTPKTRSSPARRRCGTNCRATCRSRPGSATAPRPTRRSPQADHVVKLDMHIGRVTGVPIELRAAVAHYDKASGRYTLYAGSGGAVRQKNELAKCSASSRTICACCPTTSAAISAPATACSSNSGWCCGRRRRSAGR